MGTDLLDRIDAEFSAAEERVKQLRTDKVQEYSHDQIEFPLDKIDKNALAKWLDDRIVSFIKTYFALNENQYYLQDHMVEDPIAKVKFSKYAAGAKLDVKSKTHYFIDEVTLREFQEQPAAGK